MAGIVGILTTVKLLHEPQLITQGTITIGLDGKNPLRRASAMDTIASHSDYDLIKVIHSLRDELSVKIQWRWIEGHQDDHLAWHDLDNWTRMNILMDETAKQFWQYCNENGKRPYLGWLYGNNGVSNGIYANSQTFISEISTTRCMGI